jgi:hypothetical protein
MQGFQRDNGEPIGGLERQQMNVLAEPGGWFVRIFSGWFMLRALQPCSARAQVCMKQRDDQSILPRMDEIPILITPNLKKKGK